MPRIEIIPNNHSDGESIPTIDVCRRCRTKWFEEGSALPLYIQRRYRQGECGSTDVQHPDYDTPAGPERGGVYACDCCGDTLTSKEN